MKFSEKLKSIRTRLELSQDDLASIINVSRQAITKWETGVGLPDIENLKVLSKLFNLPIDTLLDDENTLPQLTMTIDLDKNEYSSKLGSYKEILEKYFKNDEVFVLSTSKKLNTTEKVFDVLLTGGDYSLIKNASDLSPYYLIKRKNVKLLVNTSKWKLKIIELPHDVNENKFTYDNTIFKKVNKLIL